MNTKDKLIEWLKTISDEDLERKIVVLRGMPYLNLPIKIVEEEQV